MERRIRWMGLVLAILFVGLFLQLNNIQVLRAASLSNSPGNPKNVTTVYQDPRGDILSADGVVLATSKKVNDGPYTYERVYPKATAQAFSQITGFASILYGTHTGVEGEYTKYLTPHTQPVRSLKDLLTNRSVVDDVILTINSKFQLAVDHILRTMTPNGSPASAVAIDPSTGAILAMDSTPTYDPNALSTTNLASERYTWGTYQAIHDQNTDPLLGANQKAYPPGSTFKVVTTSAVLQTSPTLTNKVYPAVRRISLPNGQFLHNYDSVPCGGNLEQLVIQSCDANFAKIGMELGAGPLVHQAELYGFNHRIPLDLAGYFNPKSVIPPVASFAHNVAGLAKSAIGQEDVSATPLQMALVAAGVANGGVVMTPHVMAQIRDNQGKLVKSYPPTPWMRATSAQTAGTITTFMHGVAYNPSGTAYRELSPSLDAAVKTGTSQTGHNTTDDWMIGFAPASAPKIAVAVVVPEQNPFTVGATVAGPIVNAILQAYLHGSG